MKKLTKLAAVAALAVTSTGAFAATNPAAAGLTSVGDLIVSITKGELVRISQLSDLLFPPTATAVANLTQTDTVCIYSTTGGYNITATSPQAFGAQLRMNDGGTNNMNYALDFGGTGLPHGTNVTGFLGANTTDDLCSGGTNASITATILMADFNTAPGGAYSDTVTLTFAPE